MAVKNVKLHKLYIEDYYNKYEEKTITRLIYTLYMHAGNNAGTAVILMEAGYSLKPGENVRHTFFPEFLFELDNKETMCEVSAFLKYPHKGVFGRIFSALPALMGESHL